jgi:periplasmic protein TonB
MRRSRTTSAAKIASAILALAAKGRHKFRVPRVHKPRSWDRDFWGVESERDMYYATKRSNNTTRMVGLASVIGVNALVFWIMASGFGAAVMREITETEVAIIEVPEIEEEEPPPPPPVDVELPPPPPQVILPDFVFDAPPPPNAIQQVQQVREPVRQEVRPPPPPKLPSVKPQPNARRFQEMMTNDYPPRALRAKEEGEVTVSMCMSAQGRASNVQVVKSSGNPQFDEATVKGMPRIPFTPAKDGSGKPIAWCDPPYQLTVVWRLPED